MDSPFSTRRFTVVLVAAQLCLTGCSAERSASRSYAPVFATDLQSVVCTGTQEEHFRQTTGSVHVQDPVGRIIKIEARGRASVDVSFGLLGDRDNDRLEEIPTWLSTLILKGSSPFGPIEIRVRPFNRHPFKKSLGEIEELVNTTTDTLDISPCAAAGSAKSFFDVYVQLRLGGVLYHSHDPTHLTTIIPTIPPPSGNPPYCTSASPPPVELFTETEVLAPFVLGGGPHCHRI